MYFRRFSINPADQCERDLANFVSSRDYIGVALALEKTVEPESRVAV